MSIVRTRILATVLMTILLLGVVATIILVYAPAR